MAGRQDRRRSVVQAARTAPGPAPLPMTFRTNIAMPSMRIRRRAYCRPHRERQVGRGAGFGRAYWRRGDQCRFHAGLSRSADPDGAARRPRTRRARRICSTAMSARARPIRSAAMREDAAGGAGRGARDGASMPIFVGGTGLYFMALTEGLADIPATPAEVRDSARALLDEIGVEALHARLTERDPLDRRRSCAPAIRSACCAPMKCSKPRAGPWPIGSDEPAEPVLKGREACALSCWTRRASNCARASPSGSRPCWTHGGLEEALALGGLDPALPAAKLLGLRPLQALARGTFDPGGGAGRRRHRDAAIRQAADDLVSAPDGTLCLV